MHITLYGIPNCDSVKKARAWLTAQGLAPVFHDFKKAGLAPELLDGWLQAVDWTVLLNRRGTTWRRLSEAEREAVVDAASARTLMLAQPSLVKRPVIQWGAGRLTVGLDLAAWPPR